MQCLSLYRAAFYTDATPPAFICVDSGSRFQESQKRHRVHDSLRLTLLPVHPEIRFDIFFHGRQHGKRSVRRHKINLLFPPGTKAHLRSRDFRRHRFRIHIYKSCEHAVQRHRVRRKQQHIHRHRISRRRAISLHCHDPIHHIKAWPDEKIQIHDHSCHALCARISGVSCCLVLSLDAAVLILYSPCDVFQRMRLHLADADQCICLRDIPGKHKLLCVNSLRIFRPDGLVKRSHTAAVFFQLLPHPQTLHRPDGGPETAGISGRYIDIMPLRQNSRQHLNDHRMCRNRAFRVCFPHKIHLQQYLLLPADIFFNASDQAQALLQSLIHSLRIITAARNKRNCTLQAFILPSGHFPSF